MIKKIPVAMIDVLEVGLKLPQRILNPILSYILCVIVRGGIEQILGQGDDVLAKLKA